MRASKIRRTYRPGRMVLRSRRSGYPVEFYWQAISRTTLSYHLLKHGVHEVDELAGGVLHANVGVR